MADGGWHDTELDVRAATAEFLEHWREPVVRGVALGAEPKQFSTTDAIARDVHAGALDLAQHHAPRAKQARAGLGRDEAARMPSEERYANASLEGAQRVTERGLRDVESTRSTGDRPLVRDGDEHAKLASLEIHWLAVDADRMGRTAGSRDERHAINGMHGRRQNNLFDVNGTGPDNGWHQT